MVLIFEIRQQLNLGFLEYLNYKKKQLWVYFL